jgi:hypothetical protein
VAERDRAGRATGLSVFALGAIGLLCVFYLAYKQLVVADMLTGPARGSWQTWLLSVATKGLFLFIMGFVASSVANKGIGLYQAASHLREEE